MRGATAGVPADSALQCGRNFYLLPDQTALIRSRMTDTPTEPPVMESRDLFRCYGPLDAPKGADLAARLGNVGSPIGPSGSGESALLRGCTPTVHGQQDESRHDGEAVHRKGVGLNRDPADHAPVTALKRNMKRVDAKAREGVTTMAIADLVDDLPARLPGGRQQRTAMAA